jgi:translocation and assembly module TamB
LKRAAWSIAAVLMVVAGLLAATWGLLNTASGFRWLVGTASTLSRGQLAVEGVTGHLGAPIGFQKLVVTTDTQRITLAGGQLEWQPRALLQRQLRIELLAVRQVRVEILKKDPTPPQLPDSLRLPVNVQVAAWDVAQLDVVESGQTLSFKQLRGRVDDTGDRYTLAAAISTPWAEVDGQLGIQKDAPFDLQGRVAAARKLPLPVQATLELSGQLAAIRFRLDAQAEKMNVMAMGEMAPFAQVRLPRLLVSGYGIDPRQFAADAPHADLAFSGVFEGQPGERLLGTFSLANQQAGRLDQNRLPLASLTGAVLGDSAHADFSALAIDLGAAGQFSGEGQWRDGRFSVSLDSPSLNLAGVHRDLYPTRMRTALRLTGDAAQQTLTADLAETWGEGRFVLSHADAAVRLQEATFNGQVGKLTASGSVQLDAPRAFAATFDATQINPARLGDFPRARLNARGEVSGALLPELRLQMQFTLPPGELEGRPVKGQGRLRYASKHLSDTDIDIDLAGNRAQLKGAYGRAGDRLVWDIDAPALARLNLGLTGRLRSSGSATGEPMQPQIDAQLEASDLRLPGEVAADSLSLQLRLQAAASGVFNGRLEARGIQVAGQRISVARASVQGRRNAHTLALDAKLPDWNVTASLAGGLEAPTTTLWRGQLNQAEVQGAWPMRLSAPAALVLGRDQQQVSNLSLTLAGGKISAVHFSRQGAQLSTRGSLSNLPLAPLLGFLEQKPPFTTDLRMNGDWDLRMGNTVDGQARLVRQSGDVRLTGPALSLGLTTLGLDLSAEANRVTARLDVATREAGSAQAEGSATLLRVGDNFTLPRSAPLTWTGTLNVPDLRLAKAFLPVGVRLDARLAAQLAGSGSLAAPRVNGQVEASRIRFAMPEEGVAITDGALKLALNDDRVRVEQGELKGQSGRIVVSGEAQLKNPQAGLILTFEKFAVTNRSDRRVIVSGVTQLNLDAQRLQLTGELTADRARLEMPESSRPTLSSDVVVVGRPPREKPVAQRYPLALDLTLKLGKDFLFKGAGLDARLGGQLRVFTANQTLRGEGTIMVEEGRYAAYAQTLDIERGVLRFGGPIGNPGLDVLAVRKTPTVKAGVQVGGTVQRPVVKLYSDPALPDTEKLSWLVLGHGLDNVGQQEFVVMQVAAAALLSQADSVSFQSKLADTLGIDSFDVRSGGGEDLTSTVVSVGKRLSSRAMLSYEQSLDGLSQVVKVLYQLTPRIRLEAQAGQQSSFDAFYSREYD